jgi:predicted O-linked N-acetylglucosamine transferase (SPINDLY family)
MDINKFQPQVIQSFQDGNYLQAIALFQQCIESQPDDITNYWYLGLSYLLQGQETEAKIVWMSVILESLDRAVILTKDLLKILDTEAIKQVELGNLSPAATIYQQVKAIENNYQNCRLKLPQLINNWTQEAIQLTLSGQLNAAKAKYEKIVILEQEKPRIWLNLALVYYELFQYQAALQAILKALSLEANNYSYYYHAGLILEKLNLNDQAIRAYQQAITLNPQHIESYNNLGNILSETDQIEAAENIYRQAIASNPNHFGSYLNLGNLLMVKGDLNQGLETYRQAVKLSNDPDVYFWIVNNIRSFNCIQEAINFTQDNAQFFPGNIFVKLESLRILPFVYKKSAEIDYFRNRLHEFLDKLLLAVNLDSESNQKKALSLIERHTNYHLHYQAKNDLKLQLKYGEFIQKVMVANYPQWSQNIKIQPLTPSCKIRVGYVSYCLKNHVVGRLSLGWVKNHNQDKLEIYCYYLGDNIEDNITQEFKRYSHKFYHFTDRDNLESICEQIVTDRLHILVLLDLGMYPRMTQIAALRVAPIQCVTWMHPITSGIPTIDYFISSELIEGENAQNHYSEKLLKLPNLSICYQKRDLPKVKKDRSKFKLSEEAIVYLSSQFPSKYLPQYDYLFPSIAREVSNAQFVFVHPQVHKGKSELINHQLWQRIKQAFAEYNLNSEDYCIFLPTIKNSNDYWQLFSTCDVFLDTIGFCGCNSTLDAIESNLPVVTCPGEFFRTRQSDGILKMIQVTETVATNEAEYINIAVKLGLNHQWRERIVAKIEHNIDLLYDDLQCVRALENFYFTIISRW